MVSSSDRTMAFGGVLSMIAPPGYGGSSSFGSHEVSGSSVGAPAGGGGVGACASKVGVVGCGVAAVSAASAGGGARRATAIRSRITDVGLIESPRKQGSHACTPGPVLFCAGTFYGLIRELEPRRFPGGRPRPGGRRPGAPGPPP